jgi:hypothetical protein
MRPAASDTIDMEDKVSMRNALLANAKHCIDMDESVCSTKVGLGCGCQLVLERCDFTLQTINSIL